jgi:glyoxylase-like metal-dependent hydrolase (beta-lactamase superfamily II)
MSQPRVHIHTSSPDAFFVNSFIIEGDRSLVLVDTQFVLSEANALLDKIGQLEKPLASIIITHPHPDHYNGLATVLAKYPGTAVHATAATIAGIHETAEPKRAYWTPIVGDNYPQSFTYPDVTIVDGQHLTIDDIDIQIFDLGAAECSDNTMIALPQIDAVIVSDLVYNHVHPWLAEGRTLKWLEALDLAKQRFAGASTFFAGHGPVGTIEMIDNQATYITTVRELVASKLKTEESLSEKGKMEVLDRIRNLYPHWPLEMIIDMNIAALAAELA